MKDLVWFFCHEFFLRLRSWTVPSSTELDSTDVDGPPTVQSPTMFVVAAPLWFFPCPRVTWIVLTSNGNILSELGEFHLPMDERRLQGWQKMGTRHVLDPSPVHYIPLQVLPQGFDQLLAFPKKFARNMKKRKPENVTVIVPSGAQWIVGLFSSGDTLLSKHGGKKKLLRNIL